VLNIRTLTKQNFDFLVTQVDDWWGRPVHYLLHPIFLYQFGNTALGAFLQDQPIGFLLGFVSQTQKDMAYIHLAGVAPSRRRKGFGRLLYTSFFYMAAGLGCRTVRAITSPCNAASVAFHRHMGFVITDDCGNDLSNKPVTDYAGPGEDRYVLTRTL